MSGSTQSFDNHAKMVPLYHFWAFALVAVPTLYFGFVTVTGFSLDRLMLLAFAVGVVLVSFFARLFPLGVQDRVIRLEERLRMERLLPEDLKGRISEITTTQLIGLRFASDEELPELTRRVLDGSLTELKGVKQAVRKWRADHQRI
jgi:Family of unknown function (DUF6526)